MTNTIADLIDNHTSGWSLEQPFYCDPAVFDLETERILMRHWLYAGPASLIPEAGDYFLCEFAGESIIIVRDEKGEINALVNVCRHRGTRVCTESSGHATSLVCPYHQWVYNCDGSLRSARLMPPEFDRSQFGLHRAHITVVDDLILFCMADDPPNLDTVLNDMGPHLAMYDLPETKICHTEMYDLHANWKILNENFRECYHCGGNHPELCKLMPHIRLESAQGFAEFQKRANACINRWEKMGVPTNNVPVSAENRHHVMRFPVKEGFIGQTMDGQRVAPLLGKYEDADVGIVAASILPTFWIEISCDYVVVMRLMPIHSSLTRIRSDWLVRDDAVEGKDYNVDELTEFWRVTLEQDWALCEDNQKGIQSRFYRPGPYAPGVDKNSSLGEKGPRAFVDWYLRELGD